MRRLVWICLTLVTSGTLSATGAERQAEAPGIRLAPSPPAAATKEVMRRWHRHYRGLISPVRQEWESLARTTRERPGGRMTAGCRRLDLALEKLRRGRLPVAPDASISLHLEETLRSLAEAAASCSQGAYFLTAWRLRQADSSWRELRGRLLLYGLTP